MSEKKMKSLIDNGSFNRNAESVSNHLFKTNPYFDPQDLVQVKYEMLRSVKNEGCNVADASRQFGFSRTAYYKIEKRFHEAGVEGLCAQKTGPKSPAKITQEIVELADSLRTERPGITNDEIVAEIGAQTGVAIHKRSLQRALSKKKTPPIKM
jgi:transposase